MNQRPFKFLVVADGTPESALAGYFAARRAKHTGATVMIFSAVEPSGFHHWLGVSAEISRDAHEEAEIYQDEIAAIAEAETGVAPERVISEGDLLPELRRLIERDHEIRILAVGSASGGNPGPLVEALARGGRGLFGKRAIPVAMVPAQMTREEIHALA